MNHTKTKIILDKDYVIARVDEKVFGSFVEPLGRCIYGGLFEPDHPLADKNGFRTDVLELTKALNLSINRFPGGNYTSTYRWEDSVGPVENRPKRPEVAWFSIEPNLFGINEFVEWSRLNGSDIMMTLNLATRGVLEAMDCVEYCNFKSGTHWSDLRIAHGYKEPHRIKYWCLTNEIDGDWQVGHTTAGEYGRRAREASKSIKWLDRDIKTVLAGSSSPNGASFPSFDEDALAEAYDFVDYLSIHQYFNNAAGTSAHPYYQDQPNDTPGYLAKTMLTDWYFKSTIATIDCVKAKKRSKHTVNISFDEFNTWHSIVERQRFKIEPWQFAPVLLEDEYTMEDAVMLGSVFMTILKYAARVEIACVSELCNCISHIRTRNDGGVWVYPPYYTWLHFNTWGRGTALQTLVDSPKYDCRAFTDVPYVDAAAVLNDDGCVTLFAVNRSLSEPMPLEAELRGFGGYRVKEHLVLDSPGAKDTNTEQNPHNVKPRANGNAAMESGRLNATLPKLSWNVIRLERAGGQRASTDQ